MTYKLDESRPIYIQIKEHIEDSIINGSMKAGEKIPSTNEFARFYNINPATARQGVNELVDENILEKRRGVGMFVTEDARELLVESRKKEFHDNYILPLKKEAEKLNISTDLLIKMVKGEEN